MREFKGINYSMFEHKGEWGYKIHKEDDTILLTSTDWFESEGEASLAAIGHISLLQQGVEHD